MLPRNTIALVLLGSILTHAESLTEVASKPGQPWKEIATRSLADLPEIAADAEHDEFGGTPSAKAEKTGFFHTQKIGQRWWLVTPSGGLFISTGVNAISQVDTKGGRVVLKEKFGSFKNWATQTVQMLRTYGFNTAGAWSDAAALSGTTPKIAQTRLWSFMSGYGKKRGGTHMEAGHTGYPNDCPFIFDPEFVTFCDEHAQQLDALKDDPWIIGHFSDNELPWSRKMLENYLTLPEADVGHIAAAAWLKKRHGENQKDITDEDRAAFLAFAMDRYLSVTGAAIRKHAPHHLFLGPRLHEIIFELPEIFATVGKHADIVCVNYYRAWSPKKEHLDMWHRESGKPLMMTEFYAKAENSGMGNTGGAGWLVRTQRERGAFYQNFTLGLLESGICVGWHWHRYADNDPDDKKVDPSNRDSNKGIVNNRYKPYTFMLDVVKPLNQRVHGLIRSFDLKSNTASK